MKHITAIFLLAAMSLSMGLAAQTTQKLTATKVNEYGLIYSLPVTVFDITVEAEKTVKTPGEFYRYAKKYLNLEPVTAPSQSWTVKSVTVTPRGIADPDERYLVQFKAGSSPFMIIDDQNFPLSINTEDVMEVAAPSLPEAQAAAPSILESAYAKQAVTEEMLQSPSSAKRAELAAARIFELRQSRSDIISGRADQMPSDGKAMQLALDNLSHQEEALTAMFIGTTQTSTDVQTFTITPSADTDSRLIVARLSMVDGLVESDNLSGEPIYVDLRVKERGKLPSNEKGVEKTFPKGGLAYRIPGSAEVVVTYNGERKAAGIYDVAQLGIVFGLEPNLFTDKKAPAYVIFNPSTGAIRELGTK